MQFRCPPISDELISYLDAIFPDHAVNPNEEHAEMVFGQVTVVRHLKQVKQNQEEVEYVSPDP